MKWIAAIGLPSIIIWVIGAPVVAFVILYKNRNQLDQDHVKQYYLILYQGLTRKVFYWEFINTLRKVLIISINSILSVVLITYRIMLSLILLIIVFRLQYWLEPYKLKSNNEVEIQAIIAGMSVLI